MIASAVRIGIATLLMVLFPYLLSIASGLGKVVHIGYRFLVLLDIIWFERSSLAEWIEKTS